MNKLLMALLHLLLVAILVACSTETRHSIESEEMNDAFTGQKFSNLLVVGLYEDRALRIAGESVVAEQFSSKAVTAAPSYDLIPDLSDVSDEARISEVLAGKGFDGILTITAIEVGPEFDYEAFQAQYAMVRLLGSEGFFTRMGANADYYESGKLTLDVGLWDARSLESVWHATTDSYSQDSDSELAKSVAGFMINALQERNLIE